MLALADTEIAADLLREHLDVLWASGRFRQIQSGCFYLDPLHVIVPMIAKNDSKHDHYFLKLGAEYYDIGPPLIEFVEPSSWTTARQGTRWYPTLRELPNFKLHDQYDYPDGERLFGYPGGKHQLVCFSLSAGYYLTNHSPTEGQRWRKGVHTLAGTVNRVASVLRTQYEGPSG